MGNCVGVLKGFKASSSSSYNNNNNDQMVIDDQDGSVKVKVMTSTGGVMELYAPITVSSITDEFPGHAIFRRIQSPNNGDLVFSDPLLPNDHLNPGELYYLLHHDHDLIIITTDQNSSSTVPYRISSCDGDHEELEKKKKKKKNLMMRKMMKKNGSRVWRVKLAICPQQLTQILSRDAPTLALIDSVRTVAKCGGNRGGAASFCASSG